MIRGFRVIIKLAEDYLVEIIFMAEQLILLKKVKRFYVKIHTDSSLEKLKP